MKSRWKISFWIGIVILLLTNIFWIYQVVDNAIGMTYYKDSCEDFQSDMIQLKSILEKKTTKESAINFLEQNGVDYNSFPKGNEFIIQLNSFDMIFNENGELTKSETH